MSGAGRGILAENSTFTREFPSDTWRRSFANLRFPYTRRIFFLPIVATDGRTANGVNAVRCGFHPAQLHGMSYAVTLR
jgi:hypothetical protein